MKYILSSHDQESRIEEMVGGKTKNLALLHQAGVRTPEWVCIPTYIFQEFLSNFSSIDLEQASHEDIEDQFLMAPICEKLQAAILEALAQLKGHHNFFAVRSSATGEDSLDHSFAGLYSSYLNQQTPEDIILSVKKCWASFFTARARCYRKERHIDENKLGMAVIIQRMVAAELSGVAFSRNPVNPSKREQLIISAVYGVGEGLVSGELDADNYYVNRDSFQYQEEILEKDFGYFVRKTSGIEKRAIPDESRKTSTLTKEQVLEIAKQIIEIENKFFLPQDSEWCIEKGELYFVQTRPITSLPDPSFFDARIQGGDYILWDNSNITESYSGVTTPLTFSHISKAYRQVYVQFCEVMGVPSHVVKENEKTFRNMLGLVRGRVYYNLKNWYHMIFLFPFSSTSNGFMETMMGVKDSLKPELASLFDFTKNPPRYGTLRKIYILNLNLWRILRVKSIIQEFKDDFAKSYSKARKQDYAKFSLQELLEEYDQLNEDLLFKWKAPIISDTRCMVFFGVLKSLTEKWITNGPANLYNDLLTGIANLPSTEPTKRLMSIAELIKSKHAQELELFISEDNELIFKTMHPEVKKAFAEYIDLFGFRCMNELKLESTDLHEDPTMALEAIKGFLRSKNLSLKAMNEREHLKFDEAKAIVDDNISGVKKVIYNFFLSKARLAVKDREDLRLLRTNIFGICRRIFKAIGQRYYELKLLDEPMDVFYLSIDEIIAYQEGRSFEVELKRQASLRKAQFLEYHKTASPPDRFYTKGSAGLNFYYPQILSSNDLLVKINTGNLDPKTLIGTPCSPGVIEGVVRVVKEISDAKGLNGEIMVCERTDPGWVPLFPSTSGLLIERGSLLSHSAIVARELGIPTIVGITGGMMKKLKTGMRVRVDAAKGEIKILD